MKAIHTEFWRTLGETGNQVVEHAWESTSLGPVSGWSSSIVTVVGMVLGSRQPAFAVLGEENRLIYNDPLSERLGERQRSLLGEPVASEWPAVDEAMRSLAQGGPVALHLPLELPLADGTCSVFIPCPIHDSDGILQGMFCLGADQASSIHGELHAVQNRARSTFDTIPDPILILNPDLTVYAGNQAFHEIFGLSRNATTGCHINDLNQDGWTSHGMAECLEKVRSGGTPSCDYEVEIRSGGADARTFAFRARWITEQPLILLTIEDVTERKRTESQLRASEERFSAIFAHAAVGMSEITPEGRFLLVNDALCRILGRSQEVLLKSSVAEVTHPDDIVECAEGISRLFKTGQQVSLDKRYVHTDGSIIFANSILTGLGYGDRLPRTVLAVTIDLTGRKKAEKALRDSEARFRSIVSTATIGIAQTNREGSFNYVNDRFCQLTGRMRGDLLGGMRMENLIHPTDVALYTRRLEELMEFREPFVTEKRYMRPDGRSVWTLCNVTPILNHARVVVGTTVAAIDISDRKEAEDKLRGAKDELEKRVRQRTRELEFRAAQLARLTSELTLAEERERHRLAQVLHDHLQQLLVSARFEMSMIAGLVDEPLKESISRVDMLLNDANIASRSLTMELSPPILHEAGLEAGLRWLVRWMKEKHRLEVILDADPEAQTTRVDLRVLLFRSTRELLFNVVKHADTDQARVVLDQPDENHLRITVSDEGNGFDSSAHTQKIDGGFGLFSIRERLLHLGGDLQILSEPGKGTQMVLIVPKDPPEHLKQAITPILTPEQEPEESFPADEPADSGTHDRTRILIVDDHAVFRQALSSLLSRQEGVEVVGEAGNGIEAVEQAHRLAPNIILMDSSMPRMDGIEATKRIHARWPSIRIIGLSMYEEQERADAMLDAGACTYLSKGGDPASLITAIADARSSLSSGIPPIEL